MRQYSAARRHPEAAGTVRCGYVGGMSRGSRVQVRNTRFGSEDVEAGMHIVAPVRRAFTAPRYCRFSLNFEARRVYFSHHVLQAESGCNGRCIVHYTHAICRWDLTRISLISLVALSERNHKHVANRRTKKSCQIL